MNAPAATVANDPSVKRLTLDCGPVREMIDGHPGGLMPAHTIKVALSSEATPRLDEVIIDPLILEPRDAYGQYGWYFTTAARNLTNNPEILDAWAALIKRRAQHLRNAKGNGNG